MKFKYTIFYVENVKKTLEFYNQAFGFQIKFLHESEDYGELDTGETTLSFSSIELMKQLEKSPEKARADKPVFEIAFETNNVEEALKRALQSGAKLIQDVQEAPWGQKTSYVSDLNGYLIEICSPVH